VKAWLYGIAAAVVLALLLWRPLAAWWYVDIGNLALVRGDTAKAADLFTLGMRLEPNWHVLKEDHGRAVLDSNPAKALTEFREAACGAPCVAEAGDAEIRLGRPQDAINDYLAARAVARIATAVDRLSDRQRFDDAIALERALTARLGNGMLAEADLASAYYTIGVLDERAAFVLNETHASDAAARIASYRADAIASLRKASLLATFNEKYLLELASAEAAWGDRRKARADFERVLDLHPHQSDAEQGLARLGVPTPQPR
jgi:tetratricopeptide (TPR) repeat protein